MAYEIHRSKAQVIGAFVAVTSILGFCGYGAYVKGAHLFDNLVLPVVTVLLLAAWAGCVYMLTTLGKPLATLTRKGVVLPNGQSIPWDDVREVNLNSVGFIVDVRTDLTFELVKGRKKLSYVALNEKKLDAVMTAARN